MSLSNETELQLNQTFLAAFEPIDTRPVYEWAKDNIKLPQKGYGINGTFDVSISPYLKKPMEDLTDTSIEQLNFACATQTFKSGINELFCSYVALQNPGPTLRVHQHDSAAHICMTTRIIPTMENNPALKQLLEHSTYNAKDGLLEMPSMFIKSSGTSIRNLQSLSIKNLILEEVCFYNDAEETIKESIARTQTPAFEKSKKIIIASQPDFEGSPLHKQFMKGDVFTYGWTCPQCKKLQQYEFQGGEEPNYYGIVWDKQNAEKTLTHDQRTNNTRLVCQHCFHEVADTEDNRIKLLNNGDYIQIHKGQKGIRSYTWPCFVNKDLSFKKVALEWLEAKAEFNRTGISEQLKLFRNKKLGLFWKVGQEIDIPRLMSDISTENKEWPDETHRFLTIDVQRDCNYWLVTAWSNKVSEARLIDWGVCVGYDELVNIKNQYKIKPIHIAIDSGDQTDTVYKESIKRGDLYEYTKGKKVFVPWLCLKGDGGKTTPKVDYVHPDGIKRYYGVMTKPEVLWAANSPWSKFRPQLVLWSNYSIKTILTNIRDGKVPFKFRYNHRADETFAKQMYSESINPETGRFDNYDKPNHLFDCMAQALVQALICKCYVPDETTA